MVQQSGLEALHATVVQANECIQGQDALIELPSASNCPRPRNLSPTKRTKRLSGAGEIRYVVINPEVLWDNYTPPPADDTP